jgi:hypothetical protein
LLKLSDIKKFRVYKTNKISLDSRDRRFGTVVFNLSERFEDLKSMYQSEIFFNEYLRGYYTARKLSDSLVTSKPIIYKRKEIYASVKEKVQEITDTKFEISQYRGRNVVYDLTHEITSYMELSRGSAKTRIDTVNAYLKETIESSELESYSNKVIYFPMNYSFGSSDDVELFKPQTKRLLNIFYNILTDKDLNKDYLNGINIIVHNFRSNSFFMVDVQDILSNPMRFRRLVKTFVSMNEGVPLTDIERQEVESVDETSETSDSLELRKEVVKNSLMKTVTRFFQTDPTKFSLSKSDVRINDKILRRLETAIDEEFEEEETMESSDSDIENDIMNKLQDDEEFLQFMEEIKETKARVKRDELDQTLVQSYKEKQGEVLLGDRRLSDILSEFKTKAIVTEDIPINVLNEEMKISKLRDFDRNYNEYQKDVDMVAILSSLGNDPQFPLFVKNITKENTSDSMSKKETVTVEYETLDKKKHTFKVDLPLVVDDRFMYVNGGKKSLNKQITRLPVVKIKPDHAEITSNYTKFTVRRFGKKVSPNVTKLEKYLRSETIQSKTNSGFKIEFGNNSLINADYENSLEYEEISGFLMRLKVADYEFVFNRKQMDRILEEKQLDELFEGDKVFPIGYSGSGDVVVLDMSSNEITIVNKDEQVKAGDTIVGTIINMIKQYVYSDAMSDFSTFKAGKKFVYSRVKITSREIPMGVLLCFYKGLKEIMDRYVEEYEFVEKRKRLSAEEQFKYNVIQFKNGFLYYPAEPLRYSLLLNGLSEMDTKNYDFEAFSTDTPYLDYFDTNYGSRNVAKGLTNTMDMALDPITLDILEDMKLPTDIVGVFLYANTLLEDNSYLRQNDMRQYRIRGTEQINAYLYKTLADAFKSYKDAMRSGNNTVKVSVPQDKVIKRILESQIVDEYSILNPVLESEKMGSSTFKGLSGVNDVRPIAKKKKDFADLSNFWDIPIGDNQKQSPSVFSMFQ